MPLGKSGRSVPGTFLPTFSHYDPAERKIIFERVQDVEPVLEHNKTLKKLAQKRAGSLRHIASVPFVKIEEWGNRLGINLLAIPADELFKIVQWKTREETAWRVDK